MNVFALFFRISHSNLYKPKNNNSMLFRENDNIKCIVYAHLVNLVYKEINRLLNLVCTFCFNLSIFQMYVNLATSYTN